MCWALHFIILFIIVILHLFSIKNIFFIIIICGGQGHRVPLYIPDWPQTFDKEQVPWNWNTKQKP